MSDNYSLSPLKLYCYLDGNNIPHHAIAFKPQCNPNIDLAIEADKEDRLVLMALGRMLNQHFVSEHVFNWEDSPGFKDKRSNFVKSIVSSSNVDKLDQVNLEFSMNSVSKTHLLSKLRPVVKNKPFFYFTYKKIICIYLLFVHQVMICLLC